MQLVATYLRLYVHCWREALLGLRRNLWSLALPLGLFVAWMALSVVFGVAGMVGGLLLGLVRSAVISVYLYVLGEVLSHSKVRASDWARALGAYFWVVMGAFFWWWIASLLMAPFGPAGLMAFSAAGLIAFNAVPEAIYVGGTYSSGEAILSNFRFLADNWIEWLLPQLPFLGLFWFSDSVVDSLGMPPWMGALGWMALFHGLMLFRGVLFKTLAGSTHRQRMMKYRQLSR